MMRDGGARRIGLRVLMAAALACMPRALLAQDFAAPAPPWSATAAGLLERGLAPPPVGAALETAAIQWFGLPELATGSVAACASWRSARFGAGISRTGEAEVGWSSAAVATGWVTPDAGAALRACLRRFDAADRTAPTDGLEAGFGLWARAGPRLTLWASAPQLLWSGEAPPLERRLELGVHAELPGLSLWLLRGAMPDGAGEHALGLLARGGPLAVWIEGRDRPARGSLGLAARTGALRLSAQVESHPVLAETVRLGLALERSEP